MKRLASKQFLLVAVLAAVYVTTLTVVWIVQSQMAASGLDRLMEVSVASAVDSVDYNVEPEALRVARVLVTEWGSSANAAKADLAAALEHYDCEEINIVGPDNIIVAAAEPLYVGIDMTKKPTTDAFTALNTGARAYVTQKFRKSGCKRSDDKGGMNLWLKYVGLPFPDGGYLQLGDSYRNFRTRFQRALERLMQKMTVGERGSALLVDRENRTIISGYRPEWTNLPLADSGVDPDAFDEKGTIREISVFGVKSFVRRVRLEFADMDVYVVIPTADVLHLRNLTFSLVALVLGLVMSVGGTLFCKVIRQHERIEALFAQEAERIEKDMAMAKSIQTNALPSVFPPYPNLTHVMDINARMRTAREVGGDFYDFYFVESDKLALVIADVSGKGVPAALFMMRAKATIQSFLKSGKSVTDAVTKTNHRLSRGNDANMFVTMWVGIIDLKTGELEFVNAGHNPPLVNRVDGSAEYLRAKSGLALAAMDGVDYASRKMKLSPGDGILLYTDGVTEATNRKTEFFGEKRLMRTFGKCLRAHDSGAVIDGVLADVDAFMDGAEQADDMTLLAFRLVGAGQRA